MEPELGIASVILGGLAMVTLSVRQEIEKKEIEARRVMELR